MVLMFYIRRKNNPWTNVIYVMDRKRERERNILQKGLGICHSPVLRIWKVPGSNSSWSLDEMGVCKCWTGMWSGTVEWTREWTMELMYRQKFHFRSCSSFFIHFTSVRPHIQSMSHWMSIWSLLPTLTCIGPHSGVPLEVLVVLVSK